MLSSVTTFVSRLVAASERRTCDVISPVMVEDELDYDFDSCFSDFLVSKSDIVRLNKARGVCFAVRLKDTVFPVLVFPIVIGLFEA